MGEDGYMCLASLKGIIWIVNFGNVNGCQSLVLRHRFQTVDWMTERSKTSIRYNINCLMLRWLICGL